MKNKIHLKLSVDEIKTNEKNPRYIKTAKYKKLLNSIKNFGEMLEIRPIVIDENNTVLGGNMRLRACIEAGIKELEVIKVTGWSEAEKNEFIVKDNASYGEWDAEILSDHWQNENLIEWGIMEETENHPDPVFKKDFDSITDQNCELPIVPTFHEKHSFFLIYCSNEIDEAWIRNTFELNQKHTSHKSTDDRLSNVIKFEKLQEICLK